MRRNPVNIVSYSSLKCLGIILDALDASTKKKPKYVFVCVYMNVNIYMYTQSHVIKTFTNLE